MSDDRKYETTSIDKNLLSPSVFGSRDVGYDLLRVALENGGFIAGGFARKLVLLSSYSDVPLKTRRFLLKKYLTMDRGDVDIFFSSHAGRERTVKWISDQASDDSVVTCVADSLTGNAKTVRMEDRQFQLINIVVGSQQHVISSFDICNAMVAVKDDQAFQLAGRSDLDRMRCLKVDNWNTPYTICRAAKYIRRMNEEVYDLTDNNNSCLPAFLHPETAEQLLDVAQSLMMKLKATPILYKDTTIKFSEKNILSSLKSLIPWLPSGDLVMLATYFSAEKRNVAIDELIKRGHPPALLVAKWSDY